MSRIYVGYTPQGTREVFKATQEPTRDTHGKFYDWVMGPFRTMRGAKYYRDYGKGNPHTTTVNDCERLAKYHATHKERQGIK